MLTLALIQTQPLVHLYPQRSSRFLIAPSVSHNVISSAQYRQLHLACNFPHGGCLQGHIFTSEHGSRRLLQNLSSPPLHRSPLDLLPVSRMFQVPSTSYLLLLSTSDLASRQDKGKGKRKVDSSAWMQSSAPPDRSFMLVILKRYVEALFSFLTVGSMCTLDLLIQR